MRIRPGLGLALGFLASVACQRANDFDTARRAARDHIAAGRLEEALIDVRRAIGLARTLDLPSNAAVASSLVTGGWLCLHLACNEDALAWLTEAVGLREQALHADDPLLAQAYSLLGVALARKGSERYAQAEASHRRALSARLESRGPDHPEVATSLNNLGVLARRQGRLAEAERLHRRALAIRRATLGPDHPDVAQSQHNLGRTLLDAGDTAGATALFERAGTPGPGEWFGLGPFNSAAEALGTAW